MASCNFHLDMISDFSVAGVANGANAKQDDSGAGLAPPQQIIDY